MNKKGRRVQVHDGNWEKALRKLKRKISDSNLLQEVKDRQEFVKPTIKRKISKSQAVRRWKKYLRDQQLPPKLF
jgi:ribosomal protein S21